MTKAQQLQTNVYFREGKHVIVGGVTSVGKHSGLVSCSDSVCTGLSRDIRTLLCADLFQILVFRQLLGYTKVQLSL